MFFIANLPKTRKPSPLPLHNFAAGLIIYYKCYYKEGCATAQTKPQKQVLGILGGLGPAASCYLYQMLIDHTPASCDQDHIDIVISSRASTPDRTAFIMGKSKDDPFAVMEQDGFSLVHYGATVLAIPCNTAHYFYDRLAEALPVPVLNMPRLTVADAKAAGCTKLGILATDGTLAAETYQLACQAQDIDWAVPSEEHQQEVMSVIYDDIKQACRYGKVRRGGARPEKAGLRYGGSGLHRVEPGQAGRAPGQVFY